MAIFISFEGIDGAGKTTQLDLLRKFLEGRGRTVVIAREPGGTAAGEQIRELLLNGEELTPWTEASLFAAARAELVARVIRPALQAGQDVILDRYFDSSLAYQCFGRDLPFEDVLQWNRAVTGGLFPDCTFLLLLPAEDATSRLGGQMALFPTDGAPGPPDRMERESFWFRRAVDEGYRELARRFRDRIVEIDASRPKKTIASAIRSRVADLLDQRPQHVERAEALVVCS